MKISEQLEFEYGFKNPCYEKFMTKDKIKNVVAAELFIPIVEELYDNNIFTNWSGLEGENAHIRIPLDGFSKDNYRIVQENCKNNPNNWRFVRPFYKGEKDIAPNYSIEIYVNYEEGVTEVSDVVNKLLEEIRKLSFQDVQIAKTEYGRDSKLPRVSLDGLYKRSERDTYVSKTKKIEMVPVESYEELSEMFLEGEEPKYFYDEETETFFENKELIEKSKEYREYEKSPEKRKERTIKDISKRIDEKMSDEEKYKIIFDWCVNYFNYAYSTLNFAYAEAEEKKQKEEKLEKYYNTYMIKNDKAILSLEGRKEFVEESQNNPNIPREAIEYSQRIIYFLEEREKYKKKEKGYNSKDIDTTWTSQYGVCRSFALIYEFLCEKMGLPCKYIEGDINSNGYCLGHAWNVVMINGKLKHIDISSAVHCKDGTNLENTVDDFFLKTFDELLKIDNGRERRISEYSKKEIRSFISNSVGVDFRE